MNLSTPIEQIPRIGPVLQKRLKKLGIKTVKDLLFHFPHRYEDFSNLMAINKIKIGEVTTVQGKILEIETSRTWKKRMVLTEAIIEDQSGAMRIIWFNRPYLTKVLKQGDFICASGKVTFGNKDIYISNPAYEKLSSAANYKLQTTNLIHTGRLVPVYPETERLSSRWLRFIIKPLLLAFKNIPEILPQEIMKKFKLLPLQKALWQIHFPDSMELAEKAKNRFSFEHLFLIQLFVLRERARLAKESAVPIEMDIELVKRLVDGLPFKLTDAQKKSTWQILKDLEKSRPMNRLLEGDVGSGKTVVATIAALNVIKRGYQSAFMAPTEILAKQHFKTVSELLKDFNINIGLLTGKTDRFVSKKLKNEVVEISRKKLLEKTEGEINPYTSNLAVGIDILIGTHALIQDKVKFGKLALVILDEQHRFGVEQRARLCRNYGRQAKLIKNPNLPAGPLRRSSRFAVAPASPEHQRGESARQVSEASRQEKSPIPHLLSMTATPIPRTLALTIYGDLDLSLIDELPKGRKKITTKVIPPNEREKTYGFIKKEVKKGRQVFVICPRIEPGDKENSGVKDSLGWSEAKAVKEEYEKLSKNVFPDLKVGMLHGKMAGKEKEKIMRDFNGKKIDILVSTSVVEVGVDVPNATVMMIEGAERFGLAQLYQFRGRVGRSKYQSYCFLFTDSPSKKTRQRLHALLTCEDGFKLAEKDLQIRGPGDFSGTRQWGIPDLMMSSLTDISLVEKTRETAKEILQEDPQLKKYPFLLERLREFRQRIHLE